MIAVAILGVAAFLVGVTFLIHRGRGERSRLLRRGVIALAVALLCREFADGAPGYGALADLVKRLALLVSEVYIVLLVLTFRENSVSRVTARRLWIGAAVLGAAHVAMYPLLPIDHGYLPRFPEEPTWALAVHYGVSNLAIGLSVGLVGVACYRAARLHSQPNPAKVSLGFIVAGCCTGVMYVLVSFAGMAATAAGDPIESGRQMQHMSLLATLALWLIGLACGGLGQVVIVSRERREVNRAVDIIEPLWRATTALRPEVVLTHRPSSQRERLLRLAVETHDALKILRGAHADEARVVDEQYDEPLSTAALLVGLLGPEGVPPLRREGQRLPDLANDSLKQSVAALCGIRRALSEVSAWWVPLKSS